MFRSTYFGSYVHILCLGAYFILFIKYVCYYQKAVNIERNKDSLSIFSDEWL